ncbi:SusC/RagA family TonB-linked outer membrane protein [Chitinophaga nivalis]|uniref:SusC/RagA family TonB-linked outer membrane protein n=1 Tax=Chitinophaga nivalis TaxID=2991709 RepID=A0ABT3IUD7_9BACT|nr:SusC/RagA family TonB-linked outer membrane protein [Chitinophaga nivalis]MCW3462716.1 SusC/RagA family TonB-linked outer membrane protein [Chitinophaga nivalis]MCW3487593.1 SusC/RagA family TonB-linked outer membrane protein [Chitinophaga nivalis]
MKKALLLWLFILSSGVTAVAQTKTVSGKVSDAKDGSALPGVTVVIKGTTKGVFTIGDGSYKIPNVTNDAVLVFSFVGYLSKEVAVGAGNVINIALEADKKQLGEIVVTAVGIKRNEKQLGYSLTQVKPDDILQKSEPDMLKGLQGKVAGVDIRTSQGTPGASTRINVRGNTSFFGNNEPLIIVDGIPYNNDQVTTSSQTSGGGAYSSGLSSLDPNDIASMSVLKGAAAAALYGSRASNGAVVITTKSGSAARSKKGLEVTYSSSYAMEKVAGLPSYQNDFGAGSRFRYANANGSWGPKFGSIDSVPAWPDYVNAFPGLFPSGKMAYRPYPNNVKDLFRTGSLFENSVSANGGDEKTSISTTASYLSQDGYVPSSSFNRANISVGGQTKLDMGLTISANFSYSRSNQVGGVFGENQVEGSASSFARNLFLARNWNIAGLPTTDANGHPVSPLTDQFDNPLWSFGHNTVKTNTDRYVAGIKFAYSVKDWLNLSYQIGTNTNTLFRREVTDIGSRAAEGLGRIVEDNYQFQEIESNLLAIITPKLKNRDFDFKAIVGHNVNQRTTRDQIVLGNEIVSPGIYTIGNIKTLLPNLSTFSQRRLWGIFADLELAYKQFAFLTVTGRNDWSSTLPTNNRSYFYPSVSGSFIFTQAFGMESHVLNFGKIRASWAKVGRDADPYSLQNIFRLNNPIMGVSGVVQSPTANNPELKPEFTQDVEVGTTLEFFDRRIALDFAWYSRSSTNQIAPITLPASSGFTQYYENFGKISNKGIEIDLNVVPIKTKDFTWNLHWVFTKNVSEVVSLLPGVTRIPLSNVLNTMSPYLEPGKPFGYLRGTVDYRDEEGNLLINPTTGLLIRNPEQQMVGDPNPDFKTGINTSFNYKGFFLNALFDLTKGGDMYSVTNSSLLGRGVTKDTRNRETGYVIPGYYGDPNTGLPLRDARGNKIPNTTNVSMFEMYFGESFGINSATEWNVYDATVYTFRELTLGYDFPKTLFKRTPIGGLTVTLTGRNLWYVAPNFPKYSNFNPETNSFGNSTTQGIELSSAPTTRRYGINLKVSF